MASDLVGEVQRTILLYEAGAIYSSSDAAAAIIHLIEADVARRLREEADKWYAAGMGTADHAGAREGIHKANVLRAAADRLERK